MRPVPSPGELFSRRCGHCSAGRDSGVPPSAAAALHRAGIALLALALAALLGPARASAQGGQFGGQARADAARQMIVLGVQQGIDSLPPPSGQAFSYEYDRASDTYVRGTRLGPTVFLATEPVGAGHLNVRLSVSYFKLSDSFGPITYGVVSEGPEGPESSGVTQFGLDAEATVGLTNLALTYGVTNRFELTFNLPIVAVDAQASQSFVTTPESALNDKPKDAVVNGADSLPKLNAGLKKGTLVFRKETFSDLGFAFNDGTHVGVGRISLGAKGTAYMSKYLQVALAPELFLPSPNEHEFAGSASTAIFPRVVAAVPLIPLLKLRMDAGYDYDFDVAQLRRIVWDFGASVPMRRASFDLGVGGSKADQAIQWTPPIAHGMQTPDFAATTLTAQNSTSLSDCFVDFLAGIKLRLTDRVILSGAVTVPLNNEGFRPAALGTLAVESYF